MLLLGLDFGVQETKVAVRLFHKEGSLKTFLFKNKVSDKPESLTTMFHYEQSESQITLDIGSEARTYYISQSLPDYLCLPIAESLSVDKNGEFPAGSEDAHRALLSYIIRESLVRFLSENNLNNNAYEVSLGFCVPASLLMHQTALNAVTGVYKSALETALKDARLAHLSVGRLAKNSYENAVGIYLYKRYKSIETIGGIVLDLSLNTSRMYILSSPDGKFKSGSVVPLKNINTRLLLERCRQLVLDKIGRTLPLSDLVIERTLKTGYLGEIGSKHAINVASDTTTLLLRYCTALVERLIPLLKDKQEVFGGVYVIGRGSSIIALTLKSVVEKAQSDFFKCELVTTKHPEHVSAIGSGDAIEVAIEIELALEDAKKKSNAQQKEQDDDTSEPTDLNVNPIEDEGVEDGE